MPERVCQPRVFVIRLVGVIVAAVLGALVAIPATAQQVSGEPDDRSNDGWRFGLKAGASYARLRGDLEFPELGRFGFGNDWGFDAGVTAEVPISRSFAISPEVHVVRKFSQIDLVGGDSSLRSKLSVNYVELPLLAKLYPGDRRGMATSVVFGPAVAFKLEATREERRGGVVQDVPAGDLVKAVDWSLIFGVGFEFHELFGALTLDLRYAHGLTSIDKFDQDNDASWSALYTLIGVTF